MAQTLAEIAAERVNPTKKSSSQMMRELMEKRNAAAVAKEPPMKESMPYISPAETMRMKAEEEAYNKADTTGRMKKGGKVKKMSAGGSASKRGDGVAQRGKTRGKMC